MKIDKKETNGHDNHSSLLKCRTMELKQGRGPE